MKAVFLFILVTLDLLSCFQKTINKPRITTSYLNSIFRGTILEFIREQNDLKLFEQSLDFCNLNYELNTPNRNYTLFACTDDILHNKFGDDLDKIYSGNLVKINHTLLYYLPEIITYHVINNTIITNDSVINIGQQPLSSSSPNSNSNVQTTVNKLSGTRLYPSLNGNLVIVSSDWKGNMTVNQNKISCDCVNCINGVIYKLDSGVLIPRFKNRTNNMAQKSISNSTKNIIFSKYVNKQGSRASNFQRAITFFQLILRIQSQKAGSVIDGTLPGDAGFDPFGISDSKPKVKRMREIELKHSRIAMLASIGWPISELFHEQAAQWLGKSHDVKQFIQKLHI